MAVTRNVVDRLVLGFRTDLTRAETLYERIALAGGTRNDNGIFSPLRQLDKRDVAQFIFFEVAAQFESFCNGAFMIEVRHVFDLQPKRAAYIMGSSDKGLSGEMGFGCRALCCACGPCRGGGRFFDGREGEPVMACFVCAFGYIEYTREARRHVPNDQDDRPPWRGAE